MHLVTDTTVKLILSVSIAGITNSHKHSWDLINSVLMVIKFGLLLKKKKKLSKICLKIKWHNFTYKSDNSNALNLFQYKHPFLAEHPTIDLHPQPLNICLYLWL